ncbi:UNVERIFIED_CONTAM: hypothetical protein HDU68_000767, partial [Siphonaria sp. JEL0065]
MAANDKLLGFRKETFSGEHMDELGGYVDLFNKDAQNRGKHLLFDIVSDPNGGPGQKQLTAFGERICDIVNDQQVNGCEYVVDPKAKVGATPNHKLREQAGKVTTQAETLKGKLFQLIQTGVDYKGGVENGGGVQKMMDDKPNLWPPGHREKNVPDLAENTIIETKKYITSEKYVKGTQMTANRVAFELESIGEPNLANTVRSHPKMVQEEMWSLLDQMEAYEVPEKERSKMMATVKTRQNEVIAQSDQFREKIRDLDAAELSFANRPEVLRQQIVGDLKKLGAAKLPDELNRIKKIFNQRVNEVAGLTTNYIRNLPGFNKDGLKQLADRVDQMSEVQLAEFKTN